MKIKYKNAFSLTELLIVLVIVALLFAALAPVVTKRAKSDIAAKDSVWHFVDSDPERSSYFDSGINGWHSSLYVGQNAGNSEDDAKLVINSSGNQNQIQLRYSPNNETRGNGVASANILLRNGNVFFGDDLSNLSDSSKYSTIAGINLFNALSNTYLSNATIIGNHAANGAVLSTTAATGNMYNIFVGANAGAGAANLSSNAVGNIYIGESAGAGAANATNNTNNIAIGHKAMSHQTNGYNNIFIGAGVGNGFGKPFNQDDDLQSFVDSSQNNTIIGSLFSGGTWRNTVIGYGTYNKNVQGRHDLTAIGKGACDAIGNTNSQITCIGADSGSTGKYFNSAIENSGQHIYIGGKSESFGGRSPLEIHHNGTNRASVVLNSNLVVKGNLYIGPSGNMYSLQRKTYSLGNQLCSNESSTISSILGYKGYYCTGMSDVNRATLSKFRLESGGYENLGIGILSDEKLKTDIVLNNDGLEQILSLVPYNYTFKSDKSKKPQVGVIAQDLQKVFPSSVFKGEDGYLRIRWDEMFYACINSIKTLFKKIEVVASNVLNMEKDTKSISSSQKSLSKKIAELNKRLNKIERPE